MLLVICNHFCGKELRLKEYEVTFNLRKDLCIVHADYLRDGEKEGEDEAARHLRSRI